MYEKKHHPVLERAQFLFRFYKHAAFAVLIVSASLFGGILGYRELEGLSWIDATLNASMILGGMGPVAELKTDEGKLFAAGYALYSGVLFLVTAGILFAPLIHRLLHRFHMGSE